MKPADGDEDAWGFEVFSLSGRPTPEEEDAILDALEEFLGRDQQAITAPGPRPSAWKLAARLTACRAGILDVRTTLGPGAWAASARLPWTGRPHQGRHGRSESR